ncbi:hypothetical protein ABH994_005374 [Bradyrhizobium yuanmingense]|uniref:Uncharacterized protein n=2 Tax=Bradyrhizobium yuanmingense TaxID=108015 RepID=A0ABV4GMT9_9BRAD
MRGTFFSLQAVDHGEGLAIVRIASMVLSSRLLLSLIRFFFSLELLTGAVLHEILPGLHG